MVISKKTSSQLPQVKVVVNGGAEMNEEDADLLLSPVATSKASKTPSLRRSSRHVTPKKELVPGTNEWITKGGVITSPKAKKQVAKTSTNGISFPAEQTKEEEAVALGQVQDGKCPRSTHSNKSTTNKRNNQATESRVEGGPDEENSLPVATKTNSIWNSRLTALIVCYLWNSAFGAVCLFRFIAVQGAEYCSQKTLEANRSGSKLVLLWGGLCAAMTMATWSLTVVVVNNILVVRCIEKSNPWFKTRTPNAMKEEGVDAGWWDEHLHQIMLEVKK